eukprot:1978722-Amphidinium_carterae.2
MECLPPYCLVASEEYLGFFDLLVREQDGTMQYQEPTSVEEVNVTLIGEQGTRAYGMTEQAIITRNQAVEMIGEDGWRTLIEEAKLTASAFVLIGGRLDGGRGGDGSDLRPSELLRAVAGDILALVPEREAAMLALDFESMERPLPARLDPQQYPIA